MLETAIKEYQAYLNRVSQEKKDLFNADNSQARKVSIQVCLHKIPNILNEKRVIWYLNFKNVFLLILFKNNLFKTKVNCHIH